MTTYQLNDATSQNIVANMQIAGTAGAGYLELASQSVAPAAVGSNVVTYSDASNRLTWSLATIDTSALTIDRVWTISSGTDTIVCNNVAATLTNKTITNGVSGNSITANTIGGVVVSGTPAAGTLIKASGPAAASWTLATSYYNSLILSPDNTSSATFASLGVPFLFMGTTLQTLTSCFFMTTTVTGNGTVRLYDLTNSAVICSFNTTPGTQVPLTVTSIANMSTGPATWQLQALVSAGSVSVFGFTMKFL